MTLQELIDLQTTQRLGHVHLVYLHNEGHFGGFHLAHTDAERECGENTEDCLVHRWLADEFGEVEDVGVGLGTFVVVEHQPDTYSEDLHAEPYDLELLDVGS